jgi:hypothetical protein
MADQHAAGLGGNQIAAAGGQIGFIADRPEKGVGGRAGGASGLLTQLGDQRIGGIDRVRNRELSAGHPQTLPLRAITT